MESRHHTTLLIAQPHPQRPPRPLPLRPLERLAIQLLRPIFQRIQRHERIRRDHASCATPHALDAPEQGRDVRLQLLAVEVQGRLVDGYAVAVAVVVEVVGELGVEVSEIGESVLIVGEVDLEVFPVGGHVG